MEDAELLYPAWLASALFNNTFDWNKSIKTTFPVFLQFVTLHDSEWNTINLNIPDETLLSFRFDAFWNYGFTALCDYDCKWPHLIIKIPHVYNVSLNVNYESRYILSTESVVIPPEEIENLIGTLTKSRLFPTEFYERLIDCKSLHKTVFGDGARCVEILHDSDIFVLLIDELGNYIEHNQEFIDLLGLFYN